MHITVRYHHRRYSAAGDGAAAFFREAGQLALNVPPARGETVAEACAVHGMDAEQFAAAFNARFAAK